ncbi:MAG: hypothetical protein ACRELA_25515, partial [Candidatus Rokuibacteriota bacterium]
ERFEVSATFDRARGRLEFTSRWAGDGQGSTSEGGEPGDLAFRCRETLLGGGIETIVWNYAAVGAPVTYGLGGNRWVTIGLGPKHVHQFDALLRVASRLPDATWALLNPILEGSASGADTGGARSQGHL